MVRLKNCFEDEVRGLALSTTFFFRKKSRMIRDGGGEIYLHRGR